MMKNLMKIVFVGFLAILASCSNDSSPQKAHLKVALVDAPGEYDEVNIEIVDVKVNVPEDGEDNWQSLEGVQTGMYDLLKLTNGEEAFLGEADLPAGKMSQIRLVLGTNNELVIDGQTHNLKTPSAQQSGLKLNIDAVLVGGVTYKLILDFDADKSIVKTGNPEGYNLKPVIHAAFEADSGAIKGVVSPKEEASVVYAIDSELDTVSTYPNEKGEYLIRALESGTYKVVAVPTGEQSLYGKVTIEDVDVTIGNQTTIDTLKLVAPQF